MQTGPSCLSPPLKRLNLVAGTLCLLLLLTGCATTAQHGGPVEGRYIVWQDSPAPWDTGSPVLDTITAQRIAEARAQLAQLPFLKSLLVIKDGRILIEDYLNGAMRQHAFNVKSVGKSVLSILTGLALKRGALSSLDQSVLGFFPEHRRNGADPHLAKLTIRHLLTMTTGFRYQENRSQVVYGSKDWIAATLSLPFDHEPGTTYQYISPAAHLLAALLSRATGMRCRDFAEQALFGPLEVSIAGWASAPDGHVIGGSEMYFTARDMARLGLLYLHEGRINGQQILPAEWILESTRNHSKAGQTPYGYFWMPVGAGAYEGYAGAGHGGQFIVVVPALEMVVVTTADPNFNPQEANQHANAIFRLVDQGLIAAIASQGT